MNFSFKLTNGEINLENTRNKAVELFNSAGIVLSLYS